jgi:hypothetical protein
MKTYFTHIKNAISPVDNRNHPGPVFPAWWLIQLLAVALALLALLPRMEQPTKFLSGVYLWAEDSVVFISNTHAKGWAGVFETYAGYLHLYPKLVAMLANQVELDWRPAVMFAGWALAYACLIWSVTRLARYFNVTPVWTLIFVLLIAFQPNVGDVLYNATNAQWMFGALLFLMAVVDTEDSSLEKAIKFPLLFLIALTGPFSALLTPLLLVKYYFKRNLSTQWHFYIPVIAGGLIQGFNVFSTGRATYMSTTSDKFQLVDAFSHLFLFSYGNYTIFFFGVLFWGFLIYGFFKTAKNARFEVAFLFTAAVVVLLALVYSVRSSPMSAVSFDAGNRFTWIPYTLFISMAMVVAGQSPRWLKLGLTACLLWIVTQNFVQSKYFDMQFQSFSRYAKYEEISVPINPAGLYAIDGRTFEKKDPGLLQHLDFDGADFVLIDAIPLPDGGYEAGVNPSMVFSEVLVCPGQTDAFFEAVIDRTAGGFVQLFWSTDGVFTQNKSIQRLYQPGSRKIQFAFPIGKEPLFLRLDPMESTGQFSVTEVKITCFR